MAVPQTYEQTKVSAVMLHKSNLQINYINLSKIQQKNRQEIHKKPEGTKKTPK